MISKIPSCLAKICQETALAFKKTNGRKAIAQCAKELGVETEVLAKSFADAIKDSGAFVSLYGEIGAGKTAFVKLVAKALNVQEHVTSPSFVILNEYHSAEIPIYHFDLYRLKDIEEAMSAGAEEYIYSNNYCMIEWPEIIYPILPSDTIYIKIEEIEDKKRKFTIDIEIN